MKGHFCHAFALVKMGRWKVPMSGAENRHEAQPFLDQFLETCRIPPFLRERGNLRVRHDNY
jgi:hypothetical protein